MRAVRRTVVIVALAAAGCASTPAAPKAEPGQKVLVDFAAKLLRQIYAPRAFKAANRNWKLDAELERTEKAASFERGLHLLFRSPADIHTSIEFEKSEAVWLGFAMRRTTTGHRVVWVDPIAKALPIGAEVIAFDGTPIEQVVEQTAKETGWDSTPKFRERFADWFAVLRVQREWAEIPKPGTPLRVTIETAEGGRDVTLEWQTVPSGAVTGCPHWGKSKASYLTDLGKVTWRSESKEVPAYVFEAGGKRYGYLRIASYGSPAIMADFDRTIDAFLEKKIDGLVLDQLGNGGGNYVFALTMLSRLAADPLVAPTQKFQADETGALAAFPSPDVIRPLAQDPSPLLQGPLAYLPRDANTTEELKRFFAFVADKHTPLELTAPHYQVVREYRYDESRGPRYLGPLVLLIDELNFSAAEYTAAAFADHAKGPRATLFGATTSGAGGDQRWYRADRVCGEAKPDGLSPCVPPDAAAAMKQHGVAGIAMTVTLGYRLEPDRSLGAEIENAGVAPHRTYELTSADVLNDYAAMKAAIVETLRSSDAK